MAWRNLLRSRRLKKEAAALEDFVQNIYWGNDLSPQQAKANLNAGIVEILFFGSHSSNGLLITDDGYFLTARHCLEELQKNRLDIRLTDRRVFPLDKVCSYHPTADIALAKINVKAEPKAIRYRFADVEKRTPTALAVMREGKRKFNYGFVEQDSIEGKSEGKGRNRNYSDHFVVGIKSISGDSGGLLVNADGGLLGFMSSGSTDVELGSGVKVHYALETISKYAKRMKWL